MSQPPTYKKFDSEAGKSMVKDLPQTASEPPPPYKPSPEPVTATSVPPTATGGNVAVPPRDYLVLSLITTFCCFMPLGIIALIKSFEVRNAVDRGDFVTAEAASKTARQFNKFGIIVGIFVVIVTVIIVLVAQLGWIVPLILSASYQDDGYDSYYDD